MQTFDEYFQTKEELFEHWSQMSEEEKKEEIPVADKTGPAKGKAFNKLGSDEHLAAMQHHSAKFNEFKKSKDHADHVKKAAIDYHTKMYQAHKAALGK